ncbi:MAG: hypothetical protein MUD02_03675 [Bacteroidales bacterium]|nr:hypothetical protein [Bacteroidales bacterium]
MAYRLNNNMSAAPLEARCRKEAYTSMEDARAMARYINETRSSREIRVYKCPVCEYWHLTSRGKP